MKIVSQSNTKNASRNRLLDILELCLSELKIDDTIDRSYSLDETIDLLEELIVALLVENEDLSNECTVLAMENVGLNVKSKINDMMIERLTTVDSDSNLDVVVQSFMQSLVASGSAEPTFSGEISFPEEIVFSKEDLKPYIQDAIQSWVAARVQ